MKKRLLSLLLALTLVLALVPAMENSASAATQSSYSPYAMIEYGYSSSVTCGTVRYVSQVSSDSYFYSAYWPSSTFGYYTGPSVECGTASISMALSYIGINKTANDILSANNGATSFSTGWGGSTYYSYSASNLTGAMDNYINGGGKYSPPVIHIPGYSSAGHYVVVVGKISSNTYQILDPWQRALTKMTVNGTSAVYTTYTTFYDNIDQIHQWYNPNASLNTDVTVTFNANGGSCSTSTRKVNKGAAIGTLPTPTRSGYTFAGWYPSTNGGKNPITSSTTVSDAVTYYAHWISNKTTGTKITFNPGGGTLPGASTTLTATGTNISRGTNALIVYNCDGQTVDTNYYGTEIAVDATGKVIAKRPYQSNQTLTVPNGGFILSGHGNNTGMCTTVAAISIGSYVSFDQSSMAVRVYDSLNAYLAAEKYVSGTYGDLPVPTLGSTPFLGWFTAASGGTQVTENSSYSTSTLYAHWGCDHSYSATTISAVCGDYEKTKYTCSRCGSSYTTYADSICSGWSETRPTSGIIEEKTQYAYRDFRLLTSTTALSGYTQLDSEWVYDSSSSVSYVNSWPSGFSTSSSLYTQYNKKSNKVTASETDTAKTVVSSDAVSGYLYYHWCYADSYYSVATSSGSYTTFHAYYSTTSPDNYTCDTSDYSYKTSNTGCCTNSNWFFVAEVYTQNASKYSKLYTYEGWGDYSDWSDAPMVGGATRQVKTRTLYRTVNGQTQSHNFVNGKCTICGSGCSHSFSGGKCTLCGISCSHSYSGGKCTVCGMACSHRYSGGKCTVCGISCSHKWSGGKCTICSLSCSHSYSGGKCTICGEEEPLTDLYLYGFINGAAYGYEEDYATLGEYLFTEGSLVTTFDADSYVGVKTGDNLIWYMTDGYLGLDVTQTNLYPSTELDNGDLLYVPGGVEITFTLTENSDGSLHISYEAALPPVTLTPKYPTLSFEDEVFINVYFTADNLGSLTADDMGLITWSAAKAEGTVADAEANIPGAVYISSTGFYQVRTNGIAAKNLGDTCYFKIYIRLSDGSYLYSPLLNYSPKSYAANILTNSSNTRQKALVVAMLNYGAQAQTYFGYKPYQLMNANLTAAQKALVSGYSPSMVNGIVKVDSSKLTVFKNTGGFTRTYPTVSFEGAFSINYYFTPNRTPDGNLALYYWNQSAYNAATTLTPANATGRLILTKTDTGEYHGMVEGIAAKDLDGTIYVAAGYTSGGTSCCTGVLAYSIGTYCVSQASGTGSMQAFAAATAVYSYYAKAYFAA